MTCRFEHCSISACAVRLMVSDEGWMGEARVLFVGDDWAEAHHDVEVQDEAGRVLARRRLPEGVAGLAELHGLIAEHAGADGNPGEVVVGIETDRGPWVAALLAAGYRVYAINPLSAARYRQRHTTSGAKSDAGDAHVLAEVVRTDRGQHRPVAGDSELAEGIKVLARTHQSLIWARQRQGNVLRCTLREFYPGALAGFDSLTGWDALAVLEIAPTPRAGRALSRARIVSALRRGGRSRNLETMAERVQAALRAEQLAAPPLVAEAFGHTVLALVRVIAELSRQIERLEGELSGSFRRHPDASILRSQPGMGVVLAARVLAEFGDDAGRYRDAGARRNYAGTSPITRASGTRRVVLARFATNKRLRAALHLQAFTAIRVSPGARAYYDAQRARGAGHDQALRALANKLVGVMHGCLRHRTLYDEVIAWPRPDRDSQSVAA